MTSLEWRQKSKPKGALQKEMVSFRNRLNIRDKGKERTNGETRVASGKKDSKAINGREGHLVSLLLQMLSASILEVAQECWRGQL